MRSLMRRNWTGRRRGCRMGRAMAAICPVDGLTVNQPAVAARAVLDEAPETIGANGSWARVWRRLSMRRGASGAPMLACMDMTCTYSSSGPVGFRVLWWLARKCEQGSLHSVSEGRATMNRPSKPLPRCTERPSIVCSAARPACFAVSSLAYHPLPHPLPRLSLCQRCHHCSRRRRIPSSLHHLLLHHHHHRPPSLPTPPPHQLALSSFGDLLCANQLGESRRPCDPPLPPPTPAITCRVCC